MMPAMKPTRITTTLLCLLFASQSIPAKPVHAESETEWLSVLLAGRKVGHARFDRETTADSVTTRQRLFFELGRSGISVSMSTDETQVETPDGTPVSFVSSSTISGLEMRVEGKRIDGDRFAVKSGAAGALRDSEIIWPAGALLAHGIESKLLELGLKPGAHAELLMFQPLLQDAVTLKHEVVGPTKLDLPEGEIELTEVRQTVGFPGGEMISRAWMDDQLKVHKVTMDVMGQTLELVACDQTCAEAPNQPAEILTTSLVAAPRQLADSELDKPLAIELRSEVALDGWPGVDGQKLVDLGGNRYHLTTRNGNDGDAMRPTDAGDLASTDWLDYDTPAVKALLDGIELDSPADRRMRSLQDRVSEHITEKNLRVGYASAGDAARLREGDCTEHALLLAALGRAAGVPTRVVNGLAYTSDFGGGPHFVPHAWVAAWTGKHWQAFDAALPGKSQLRIAVHADDGDPWRFYQGLEVFGRMKVERIEAVVD
jgi:hypothetical protein